MPYQYIEAPSDEAAKNDETIFLAGGISNCPNWQKEAAEALEKDLDNITVYNPRRKNFEMFKGTAQFKESVIQIGWEFERIRSATQVLFWFTSATVQPITLYELGAALQRNKDAFIHPFKGQRVFLGCDDEYSREFDIKVQAKLIGYHWDIVDSLSQLIQMVKVYNNNLERVKQ